MIGTQTALRLGTLETESKQTEDHKFEYGQGVSPVYYRPVGTPMLNDGKWHYWIDPNHETYRIGHDGTGWRVTCDYWGAGGTPFPHTYRLVTADFAFTDRLPTDAGPVVLEVGATYELRREAVFGPWGLYRVD